MIFFVLSTAGLGFGTALIVVLLYPGGGMDDGGARSLLIRLSLLTFVTLLEFVTACLGYRDPNRRLLFLAVVYEWTRIAIGDIVGWRSPFLDPRLTLWVQAHPLYLVAALVPIAV